MVILRSLADLLVLSLAAAVPFRVVAALLLPHSAAGEALALVVD